MFKHACALLACVVISAAVCGLIGEAVWPSGPFIGASIWLACVAAVVAPIVYAIAILARHDARLLRNQSGAEKRSTIRPIAMTTCIVTIAVTFGLGAALRWLGH